MAGQLIFVCLSEECSNKFTTLAHVNGTEIIEDITQLDGVKSDKDAALKVFQVWPHWVCCNGSLFVFDIETGMWSDEFNVHFKV